MTNAELIKALTDALLEKHDAIFTVGYLSAFLEQIVNNAPTKYQSQVHSDLVWHLNRRLEA